jgi:hypothetical protein
MTEEQEKVENKILTRVRKMLNIANNDAASEEERDTALQMSYRLLAKHNLAMIDVDAHTAQKEDPRDRFTLETYSMVWSKHVGNIVAELFFCKYYSGGKINTEKCRHYFVGKESNATTAMFMTEHIIKSIIKECRIRYKHALCPEARSFALGAINRLSARVKTLRTEADKEVEATPGTALVLANLYKTEYDANALVITNLGVKLSKGSGGKQSVKGAAYGAGKEYGNNISLAPQIGGSRTNQKRIT